MVVKSDSCILGNAGVQLIAQARTIERTLITAPNSALEAEWQRGSLLARKRTEKTNR